MSETTVKLYVVGPVGKFVPGYGTRMPGDYFEMRREDANALAGVEGFSLKDPNAKPAPKPTRPTTSKED